MGDRAVKVVVDNDSTDEPVIDDVAVLETKTEPVEIIDKFLKPAEELKSYGGTSAAFKRKTTTTLKKFQQGIDGTGTKQVKDQEFITGYDAFDVVEPPYNLDYLAKLYVKNPIHYSACNAKVSNIVGLGYTFSENATTKRNLEDMSDSKEKSKKTRKKLDTHKEELFELLDQFNEEDSFQETLIKVWRDYEATGNGYIEIGRKKGDNTIGYVGHIPAQTVRIRRKRDGYVQISGFKVQFFAHFGHSKDPNPIGNDKPNEIIHISKYSPISGFYGVPDVVAATQAVAGIEFANRFNLDYFENNAIPRHIIILKGAKLGGRSQTRIMEFFETRLKGTAGQRSLFIPLPGDTENSKVDLKVEKVESGTQDSSFEKYRKANISDILAAHRVPITKISVSEGASLAVAKDADKTFKEQVCNPEQKILEKKLNKIIKELSDAFVLKLNEMTLTDENTQSQIDERRRKTGVETANEQRIRRGQPTIEGGDELFDMNAKANSGASPSDQAGTTNRNRDSQRSAGATDSAGEARNPKGEGRTTP